MLGKLVFLEKFADGTRMVAEFTLNGKKIKALIDTGASANYFCTTLDWLETNKKEYVNVVGFTGQSKRGYAVKVFQTDLFSLQFEKFYQINLENLGINCVLGAEFLIKNKVSLPIEAYTFEKISEVNFNIVEL